MIRPLRLLGRFHRRESGSASIEFVVMVPMVMIIFMASIEAGWYQAKHVMMERGLDLVMRELRLGTLGAVDHDDLRDLICDVTPILNDCQSTLKVEMTEVSTETFVMPNLPATCVDRGNAVQPLTNFTLGSSDTFMIVRVCSVQDPMFPTTGMGLEMRADALGGYQMVTASIFVNEPR